MRIRSTFAQSNKHIVIKPAVIMRANRFFFTMFNIQLDWYFLALHRCWEDFYWNCIEEKFCYDETIGKQLGCIICPKNDSARTPPPPTFRPASQLQSGRGRVLPEEDQRQWLPVGRQAGEQQLVAGVHSAGAGAQQFASAGNEVSIFRSVCLLLFTITIIGHLI